LAFPPKGDVYNYTHHQVNHIQLLVYKVRFTDNVNRDFNNIFNSDNLNMDIVDIPKYKLDLIDKKILPLTMNLNNFGSLSCQPRV